MTRDALAKTARLSSPAHKPSSTSLIADLGLAMSDDSTTQNSSSRIIEKNKVLLETTPARRTSPRKRARSLVLPLSPLKASDENGSRRKRKLNENSSSSEDEDADVDRDEVEKPSSHQADTSASSSSKKKKKKKKKSKSKKKKKKKEKEKDISSPKKKRRRYSGEFTVCNQSITRSVVYEEKNESNETK